MSAIESVGNVDQIALALRNTLLHNLIRHHTERILGNLNSERINAGLQAVDCMQQLVDMIVKNQQLLGEQRKVMPS